jgi:hypothetical protein
MTDQEIPMRGPVFLLCALLSLPAYAAPPYTADALVAKNIEARGGLDKLHALSSLRRSGRLIDNGGQLEMALVETKTRNGGIRVEASVQGLTLVQAYDGKEGWQINPFQGRKDPERMPPDDAKELASDADLDGALVDYKAKGSTLVYLGTEDVDGTPAHKLKLIKADGDSQTIYLDPDAFLEIRIVSSRSVRGALQETVTDFGDYEQVDGVYVPLAIESGPKGSTERQKIEYSKAEGNIKVDPTTFHFPVASK